MRITKIICSLILGLTLFESAAQKRDSVQFKLEEFYQQVKDHHPIARQATLIIERGRLTVTEARGSFDPKIVSDYNRKTFDGKNYFDIWDTYVKIPTLLNVDFKAGYERNDGLFLNPENTVPGNGLYYAGVSVPIGQGLIYNQNSIGLQKSKFENKSMKTKAISVVNNLFLDANFAYWWWFENYQKQEAVRTGLGLIEERFEGIRQSVLNGESAAIDSVEMLIQVQQWTNSLREAELHLQNSLLLIQNFLWSDELNPSSLNPVFDNNPQNDDINSYLEWALANHPDLQNLIIESNIIELDRKLNAAKVLPEIDLNYNVISTSPSNLETPSLNDNHKLGLHFAFPLLVRKERSKLKMVKIKQQEYGLKIDQKSREVLNKIQQSYNKVFTLQKMIEQQEEVVANYYRMLDGENTKFQNGESSIFLLNSRENKKLTGEIKLIGLKAKYHRAIGELQWSTGSLGQQFTPQEFN